MSATRWAATCARLPTVQPSALEHAESGALEGDGPIDGQTTGVPRRRSTSTPATDEVTAFVSAGPDVEMAGDALEQAREGGYEALADSKRAWLEELLADAPLPDTDDEAVLALARRALITLVTDTDRETGAIVASIATQSPYGEDWPRDGAFFDYALDVVGLHDWVDRHHDFYVETQQTDDDSHPVLTDLGVPPGNWGMNYYADGVVGGPIPWEIDETGYTLWNFWEHHRATGDTGTLRERYPAIRLSADFLAECRDEATGLQCPAIEDDNPGERQTIVGATTVWLGLDARGAFRRGARRGARTPGRWGERRDELATAIDAELWQGDRWGDGASAPLVWPACYRGFDDERMTSHLEVLRTRLDRTFVEPGAGEKLRGQYEAKGLIALAKAWRDDPERLEWVRDGLRWLATEHASPDTHVMGEAWVQRDGEVVSVVSQPHAWEQVLFYLAALEAWPPEEVADAPPTATVPWASCGQPLSRRRMTSRHRRRPLTRPSPTRVTTPGSSCWWSASSSSWARAARRSSSAVDGAPRDPGGRPLPGRDTPLGRDTRSSRGLVRDAHRSPRRHRHLDPPRDRGAHRRPGW
ncbi:MAG: hypothetical protein U5R31_07210 [Acidimicrobiia bacterium]|nr:hypothetical protein [Acidimicrobiia bacterium]